MTTPPTPHPEQVEALLPVIMQANEDARRQFVPGTTNWAHFIARRVVAALRPQAEPAQWIPVSERLPEPAALAERGE